MKEKKNTSLGWEITNDISSVSSPQRSETFFLNGSAKAFTDTFVWFLQPTRLKHLILILDQKLHTFNGCSSCFWHSSRDTTHEKINSKPLKTFLSWGLNTDRWYFWHNHGKFSWWLSWVLKCSIWVISILKLPLVKWLLDSSLTSTKLCHAGSKKTKLLGNTWVMRMIDRHDPYTREKIRQPRCQSLND